MSNETVRIFYEKSKEDTPIIEERITMITPKSGWQFINFQELIEYIDLLYFLVWREIKVLYAQTILGVFWAILQPLIQIVIFTIIFGKVAKISTEGIPYILFSTVAIIPWSYLSQSMTQSSNSLINQQRVLRKIYFPRFFYPITPVISNLLNFCISVSIILVVMVFYRVPPTLNLFFLPIFILTMISVSAAVGMGLSAMAIRFRDVKHAMSFAIRMLMYSAPIVYSASSIPEKYRLIYSLNPLVGIIEGFRSCLLGTNMHWEYIWPGMVSAFVLLLISALYFKRMEKVFVDVI